MSEVRIVVPYREDKDLGRAYNEAMALIPSGDWACLIDYDAQLLTPDAGAILAEYVRTMPDAGLLTCYTNRLHPAGVVQLLNGEVSEDSDIRRHIALAEKQREKLYQLTEINRVISGFLMMISRRTWEEIKFTEGMKCLGVDNDYSRRLMEAGKRIYRMDGLYVFHQYRMMNGIRDKTHLL